MKLVASIISRDELDRYLIPCVSSLLKFVDEVRLWDDGSEDGTALYFEDEPGVEVDGVPHSEFYEHEGKTRQKALEFALDADPTHILAIDADEFVADGQAVRKAVEQNSGAPAFSLCMSEVWKATESNLSIRVDGGWAPHRAPILWKVPDSMDGRWRIPGREAASGRVPEAVIDLHLRRQVVPVDVDIQHWGWVNESERAGRYARYAGRDGFGHANSHIQSILNPDSRVRMETVEWPEGLDRKAILARANRGVDIP